MKEILLIDILNHKIRQNKSYDNGGFYLIKNIKNKHCYIGKSINYMSRLKQHIYKSSDKSIIDKELNLNIKDFKFYLISSYKDYNINFFNRKLETKIEQKYIFDLKTKHPNGYNSRIYGHI